MKIDQTQLKGKPKQVGSLDGKPVHSLETKGGLHILASAGEIISAGPHRAVARHIAQKQHPAIKFSELSKSDFCPEESYLHLIPKYEALTLRLQRK